MVLVKKLNSILDISQINIKGCYFENLTLSIDISKRAVKAPICPSKAGKNTIWAQNHSKPWKTLPTVSNPNAKPLYTLKTLPNR